MQVGPVQALSRSALRSLSRPCCGRPMHIDLGTTAIVSPTSKSRSAFNPHPLSGVSASIAGIVGLEQGVCVTSGRNRSDQVSDTCVSNQSLLGRLEGGEAAWQMTQSISTSDDMSRLWVSSFFRRLILIVCTPSSTVAVPGKLVRMLVEVCSVLTMLFYHTYIPVSTVGRGQGV